MFITIVSLRRELVLPSYQMLLAPAGKNQAIVSRSDEGLLTTYF
jgi:hypothetical protein